MILKFFKSIRPATIVMIFVCGLLVWLRSFIYPAEDVFSFDKFPMPLTHLLYRFFPAQTIHASILAFLLWMVHSFFLVWLNTKFFFLNERSFLPAFFFVLSSGIFLPLQRLNPVIISSLLLLFSLERIFISNRQTRTVFSFFDAGLLIGVGSLFYANLIFYFLIVWIGLVLLRPFIWREWVSSVIGLATPFVFTVSYYFLMEEGIIIDFFNTFQSNIFLPFNYMNFDIPGIIFLSYLGFLIFVASFRMIRFFSVKKVSSRKFFKLSFWVFILTVILYFTIPSASVELLIILLIPVSYLLTHFFLGLKTQWLGEVLFLIYIAGIVFIQFY
jgi:hypothetical protein